MISETISRIRSTVSEFKLVDGAAGFMSAAESNPKVTPCCFVIPLAEDPSPSAAGDFVIQNVKADIGVVFVVRNLKDAKGVAALEDLTVLRGAVKANLLGWQPVVGYDPYIRGRGNLLAFRDGHMWWQDIYKSSYMERSEL